MDKILFFDIDGTLGKHGVITESNLKVLHLLKEKGYKTFICTGRAPFYASRLFGDLVSGIISCNGRYILYEGKKLYSRAFTKKQLDYFHLDKDNAYAFGDGYNDQAMFREVGHGIAMGNAVDVLKEKATYITDNFDQEGILKALYHEKLL